MPGRSRRRTIIINDLAAHRRKSGVGFYVVELLKAFAERQTDLDIIPLSQTLVGKPLTAASKIYERTRRRKPARKLEDDSLPKQTTTLKASPSPNQNAGRLLLSYGLSIAKHMGQQAIETYLAGATRLLRNSLLHEPDTCPSAVGCPTIVTVQDLSVATHPEWHPPHRVRKYAARFAAGVAKAELLITSAESVRQELIHQFGADPAKVAVAPLAPRRHFRKLPQALLTAVQRRLELPERFMVFVGTIEPRKNVETLLHAFACLPARIQRSTPLLLAGGWGWRSDHLREMLKQSPWAGNVRWLGYLADDDLTAVVNLASLLVYPSLYEGFGLPPLEAMACGTPVVCSHAGGLKEAVGDAASIIDPRDPNDIASQLQTVLDNPERADELRQAGLMRLKLFSWNETARRTEDVYRRAA